ncbi:hypothetical protein [Amycolatopsis sp. cmx-11-12]
MTSALRDLLVSTGEDNIFGWSIAEKPVDFSGYWGNRFIAHPG